MFNACRKDRRPNRIWLPSKKELRCRPTHPTLARPHAATSVQLGRTPGRVRTKMRVRNVLASANNSIRRRQAAEFTAQSECPFQQLRKPPCFFSLTEQPLRFRQASGSGKTGDLPFHKGQFDASDTRWFASAEHFGDCCLLEIVDSHAASLNLA